MADIKQAAKWIANGHVVKRSVWLYELKWDGIRLGHEPNTMLGRVGLTLEDLLAEDWEIA